MAYALEEGDIIAVPHYRDLAFVTYMGISAPDTFLSAFERKTIKTLVENNAITL